MRATVRDHDGVIAFEDSPLSKHPYDPAGRELDPAEPEPGAARQARRRHRGAAQGFHRLVPFPPARAVPDSASSSGATRRARRVARVAAYRAVVVLLLWAWSPCDRHLSRPVLGRLVLPGEHSRPGALPRLLRRPRPRRLGDAGAGAAARRARRARHQAAGDGLFGDAVRPADRALSPGAGAGAPRCGAARHRRRRCSPRSICRPRSSSSASTTRPLPPRPPPWR